jgi:CAAX protease family protein
MSVRSSERVAWSGIILYIALTFAISWGFWLSLRAVGVPFFIRTVVGMFGPALSALLVRLVRRERFDDAALRLVAKGRLGAGWMYLAAYVAIPLLIFAGRLRPPRRQGRVQGLSRAAASDQVVRL